MSASRERRRSSRRQITDAPRLTIGVYEDGVPQSEIDAELVDYSDWGLRVNTGEPLRIGSLVSIGGAESHPKVLARISHRTARRDVARAPRPAAPALMPALVLLTQYPTSNRHCARRGTSSRKHQSGAACSIGAAANRSKQASRGVSTRQAWGPAPRRDTRPSTRVGRVEDGRGCSGRPRASWSRFPSPLIEPDVRISRIRLSDRLHPSSCRGRRSQVYPAQAYHA